MGEFAAKYRPDMDLDEFERRLRAAAPGPSGASPSQQGRAAEADPLAELARLVGGESPSRKEDPFEALFRAQAAVRDSRDASAPVQGASRAVREPHFGDPAQHHDYEPQDSRDFPAQEFHAGQPSWQAGQQDRASHAPAAHEDPYADPYAEPAYAADPYAEAEPQWADEPAAYQAAPYENAPAAVAPVRKRKVAFVMAFALIVGVLGIGATLALRGKSSGEVVTIQANSDPAKIKPETSDATSGGASQTLFDRKADTAVAKVVNKYEQPADLNAAVKSARVVGPADAIPAPPPPAPVAGAPAEQDTGLPPPKKVKTVSVRADGSVIGGPPAKPQPAPNPATMTMGLPPVASTAPQLPRGTATRTPSAATPGGLGASTTQVALHAPARPKPAANAPAIKPTAASATAAAPAAASAASTAGTGWAVQLSSSPSEDEARASATSLSAKYAGALQGRHASFAAAQKGDVTVYRVRIGHLAEETAKAMCASIKSQGGGCFATKM